ncbi:hypothetical protein SOM59_13680 [Pseudomonas coleopterorum]|uniref:hypothetical protein n=1 Tax=Pseudomonas TaxID=286 RepID=UPI000702D537|nr:MULTISPECIES: hypothetical protein [Pseudomonas]KQQ57614.1 hypothetical protein ASF66_20180 [Pseudomonas sp. Leaf129]MBD8480913.1 hypothetical protein [Pseudomonas coleopterorum]MDY1018149.1 hypothetical protein [Pseudomonas coleopterorum]
MSTSLKNACIQRRQFEQLHNEVAAFTEEMRQAESGSGSTRPAILSFAMGAATATFVFAAAATLALMHN